MVFKKTLCIKNSSRLSSLTTKGMASRARAALNNLLSRFRPHRVVEHNISSQTAPSSIATDPVSREIMRSLYYSGRLSGNSTGSEASALEQSAINLAVTQLDKRSKTLAQSSGAPESINPPSQVVDPQPQVNQPGDDSLARSVDLANKASGAANSISAVNERETGNTVSATIENVGQGTANAIKKFLEDIN